MKLSATEIQSLYKFTRQHYVYHYDIQTELVDHLANDIEQIWATQPNLSFEEARDTSFKKFGVFGFMDVVEAKQKQMNKKYIKTILTFAKDWFRLPKIVVTILLIFVFYSIQKLNYGYEIYTALALSILIIDFYVLFKNKKKLKIEEKITGKRWLFQDIIYTQGMAIVGYSVFYTLQFFIPNNSNEFLLMGTFKRVLLAILFTSVFIVGYIMLVVIPKKAGKLLAETYPEYNLI